MGQIKFGKFQMTWGKQSEVPMETKSYDRLWATVQENLVLLDGAGVSRPYSQVSSVNKAVKALCDNAPQAVLTVYDKKSNTPIDESDPLVQLLRRPSKDMTERAFIRDLVGFYALDGEAFIYKTKSIGQATGKGRFQLPAELAIYRPCDVSAMTDRDGKLTAWRVGQNIIQIDEMMFSREFNPYDLVRGMSPMLAIKKEVEMDYLACVFNLAFFKNDAMPGAFLSTEKNLTEDQVKRIREHYSKKHSGAANKHRIDVLEGGLKAQSITPSHKDMDFLEQRKYAREELLGTWRTPKALFNITDTLNYATFQGQMKVFWQYGILPILKNFEDTLTLGLCEPYDKRLEIRFDVKNVPAFQEDFAGKVTSAKTLFDMGFTGNEVNDRLDLGFEEEDWRDQWWINYGMVPASEAGDIRAAEAAQPAPVAPQGDQGEQDDETGEDTGKAGKKAVKPDLKGFDLITWQKFVNKQEPIERLFEKRISRYFHDQRVELLKSMNEQNYRSGAKVINWEEQDLKLAKFARPVIEQSVREGVALAKENLGEKKAIADEIIELRLRAYIGQRMNRITGINKTSQNRINAIVDSGVTNGATVEAIAQEIRGMYNDWSVRSRLIARTESAGAVNGGSDIYYKESGVERMKWVTAGDEAVRESHRELNGQVKLAQNSYSNGLMFPGDQSHGDAGEVINCRCVSVPLIQGDE